ncbi:MAG: lantibiotic dehydratase C-terminal domain-containing protein [Pseudonocardiaceae bacterium]
MDTLPVLGRDHGHAPGSSGASWLYAKLYVAEHRMNSFLVGELPELLADLGERACWFVRYPQAREAEDGGHVRWELGAIGHGPAAELAEHLCNEIRAWSVERDQRKPTLTAYPTGTPDSDLHGTLIDKTHTRLVLTYNDNA